MGKNRICELLGIMYPIIQAPMNWVSGADLVAAVSNAGHDIHSKGRLGEFFYFSYLSPHSLTGEFNVHCDIFGAGVWP